jgi:hypothetical protein
VKAWIPARFPPQYDRSMNTRLASISETKLHKIQQIVKWIVYTLLIVN